SLARLANIGREVREVRFHLRLVNRQEGLNHQDYSSLGGRSETAHLSGSGREREFLKASASVQGQVLFSPGNLLRTERERRKLNHFHFRRLGRRSERLPIRHGLGKILGNLCSSSPSQVGSLSESIICRDLVADRFQRRDFARQPFQQRHYINGIAPHDWLR